MTDLSDTLSPKSNQLNADDLIVGPRTILITDFSRAGSKEQPIAVHFDGDNNKPYLPCLSMRRVIVQIWGPDGKQYVGRSLTIYRDPEVIYGGQKVGGIRISHASHIGKAITMALTATQKARKPFTVEPLRSAPVPPKSAEQASSQPVQPPSLRDIIHQRLQAASSVQDVIAVGDSAEVRKVMEKAPQPVKDEVNAMLAEAFQRHQTAADDVPSMDDTFPPDRTAA